MRNINKPTLFIFKKFLYKFLVLRFKTGYPESRLTGKRLTTTTGRKHFLLRVRKPFKLYKLSSFIATRVRGSLFKKKFLKPKIKKNKKKK